MMKVLQCSHYQKSYAKKMSYVLISLCVGMNLVSYFKKLINSSVVPSHLAISAVFLELMPPSNMIPSFTSQLQWSDLLYCRVWLLVHPTEVSW